PPLAFNRTTRPVTNHLRMAGKPKKPKTNRFYRDLGAAIRLARLAAGKSIVEVAEAIGMSPPQLQRYESADNRAPVAQLVMIVDCLDVPVSQLLSLPGRDLELASLTERLHANGFHSLLESWAEIKDEPMRAAILNMARSAANLDR